MANPLLDRLACVFNRRKTEVVFIWSKSTHLFKRFSSFCSDSAYEDPCLGLKLDDALTLDKHVNEVVKL